MSDHDPGTRVVSGLAVSCGGVVLRAIVSADGKTVRIVQEGSIVNGFGAAVEAARALLVGRVHRTLPLARVEEWLPLNDGLG